MSPPKISFMMPDNSNRYAFEIFSQEENYQLIYGWALKRFGNPADAEDATHDCYYRCEKAPNFPSEERQALRFISAVLKNLQKDRLRKSVPFQRWWLFQEQQLKSEEKSLPYKNLNEEKFYLYDDYAELIEELDEKIMRDKDNFSNAQLVLWGLLKQGMQVKEIAVRLDKAPRRISTDKNKLLNKIGEKYPEYVQVLRNMSD